MSRLVALAVDYVGLVARAEVTAPDAPGLLVYDVIFVDDVGPEPWGVGEEEDGVERRDFYPNFREAVAALFETATDRVQPLDPEDA